LRPLGVWSAFLKSREPRRGSKRAVLRSLHGSCRSGRLPAGSRSSASCRASGEPALLVATLQDKADERDPSGCPSTAPPVPLPSPCRQVHSIISKLASYGRCSGRHTGGAQRARGGAVAGRRPERQDPVASGAPPRLEPAGRSLLAQRREGGAAVFV